jgi:filamentous hemagglutinin
MGDVNVNANISAGFTTADTTGELTNGGAWTYRIAAGADVNSADVLATNNVGTGNFTLADGKLIRTGTGDIEVATGDAFNLASADSAIYTAGETDTREYSQLGNFVDPTIVTLAKYSVNGGDITLNSKGNVNGADSTQLPANWLFRQGRVDSETGLYTKNTSWWTFFRDFKQNIGALGGGDVNINAGGEINDISAVIATNGRVFGTGPADGKLIQNGGGDLTIQAGGNILGGLYMVDKGTATIRAGGGLLADVGGINTAFALGDGVIDVATLGQLDLMTVFNPTLTGMSVVNVPTPKLQGTDSSLFSTYGSDSAVKLTSVSSGVKITNDTPRTNLRVDNGGQSLHLLPGTLSVTALGGDLTVDGQRMALMPSAMGDLKLAASDSFNLNAVINMSDRDPKTVPSVLNPVSGAVFTANVIDTLINTKNVGNTSSYHSATPLHQGDSKPVVIYAGDDIVSGVTAFGLLLPKKADIFAGNDIKNLSVFGQNLETSDVTTISAGNDILYSGNASGVQWGGLGHLDITAGRNVDLNSSDGFITRGNLDNPYLPEAGANLSVLVGAAGADDQAFIAKYLNPVVSTTYSRNLTSFVKKVTGKSDSEALSDAEAWAQFQTMDTALQHQFVQFAFFSELKQAGIEHNDPASKGFGSYKRGFDAIATYFPKDNYDGKLDLSFSQLKTERGGDLNVMAPGGSVVIGLPKTPPLLIVDKSVNGRNPASQLGMFTVKGGDINVFAKNNIDVAQSRQFTIAGGDILDWSSTGDIDAGKGSKTASSAPPPLVRTDASGNTFTDLSGVVSGSGIGTLQTLSSAPIGNVYLIAPAGTVNAGDAGIRSAGNLLVAAQRVVGADNISVGGVSSGVPAVSSTSVSFSAPASADSNNTNSQGDQLGAGDKLGQNSKLAGMPSVISVEVLSLGDESAPNDKETSIKKCKDEKNKKDCAP